MIALCRQCLIENNPTCAVWTIHFCPGMLCIRHSVCFHAPLKAGHPCNHY